MTKREIEWVTEWLSELSTSHLSTVKCQQSAVATVLQVIERRGGRERETDRQTDRQRQRQRGRERQRGRGRRTETDRQRQSRRDRKIEKETDRRKDRDRQRGKEGWRLEKQRHLSLTDLPRVVQAALHAELNGVAAFFLTGVRRLLYRGFAGYFRHVFHWTRQALASAEQPPDSSVDDRRWWDWIWTLTLTWQRLRTGVVSTERNVPEDVGPAGRDVTVVTDWFVSDACMVAVLLRRFFSLFFFLCFLPAVPNKRSLSISVIGDTHNGWWVYCSGCDDNQ